MSTPENLEFAPISGDALTTVTGGTHHTQASSGGGIWSFFDNLYKGAVFHFGAQIGGTKLAEKMYGSHVTAHDKQRAQTAMHQFLADGHKLPKGVPNLFG
jgi:hypothetical protein